MDQSQSEFVVIDPYVDEDLLNIFASLDPKLYPLLPIYTKSRISRSGDIRRVGTLQSGDWKTAFLVQSPSVLTCRCSPTRPHLATGEIGFARQDYLRSLHVLAFRLFAWQNKGCCDQVQ